MAWIYFWKSRNRIYRRRQWHPTPVLLPGKSHGWRSLEGWSPWGHWGSDTTEQLHFHFSLSCIGEGNGNPLQCSCLENPRDGEAWWAAVCGVEESQTRLKRRSSSSSSRGSPMPNGSVHYLTERIRECYFSFKISEILTLRCFCFCHPVWLWKICLNSVQLFLQFLAPGWALSVTLTSSDFVSNLITRTRTLVLRATYSLPKPAFPPGLPYSLPHYIYHSSGCIIFWLVENTFQNHFNLLVNF